jgi:hypothetical protein
MVQAFCQVQQQYNIVMLWQRWEAEMAEDRAPQIRIWGSVWAPKI